MKSADSFSTKLLSWFDFDIRNMLVNRIISNDFIWAFAYSSSFCNSLICDYWLITTLVKRSTPRSAIPNRILFWCRASSSWFMSILSSSFVSIKASFAPRPWAAVAVVVLFSKFAAIAPTFCLKTGLFISTGTDAILLWDVFLGVIFTAVSALEKQA